MKTKAIDKYFKQIIENSSNFIGVTDNLEPSMISEKECPIENCVYWKPVESSVTKADIEYLEKEIGFKLPNFYIDFLKYMHFYELRFSGCEFIPHPINSWKNKLISEIQQDKEKFIQKGYIIFAYHFPEGAYYFDTNDNYSIVIWTPQKPKVETEYESNSFTKIYDSFEEMMRKLNNDNLIVVDNNAS